MANEKDFRKRVKSSEKKKARKFGHVAKVAKRIDSTSQPPFEKVEPADMLRPDGEKDADQAPRPPKKNRHDESKKKKSRLSDYTGRRVQFKTIAEHSRTMRQD